MDRELICGDCNMVFCSTGLFEKHKALFCIGSEVGHLQVQKHRCGLLTRDKPGFVNPKQTKTPDLVQLRGQQSNTTRWRSVDAKPKPARAEEKPATSQTERAALQDLTHEFQKLRRSFEENLPKWTKRSTDTTEASGRQLGHSERLEEMREMATLHERQLALIRAHNQQLEQQRDELSHQVSVLSEQSNVTHLESLLLELREQEERNEETLQQLAEHLRALHVQEVPVPADEPDPRKNKKMYHDNYELISSADGPLSTQIKALWQAYVQSGGSDPAIVAQMMDLQAEAQSLEKKQPATAGKAKKKKVKPPPRVPSWELLAVEQENQRLEEEILRIQLAREPYHNYDAAVRTELELIQRENLLQIASLQAEMERSKEAPGPRRQPPPPPPLPLPLQPNAPLSLLQARSFSSPMGGRMLDSLDSLGPAPYNPAAGFMVFYDLMLGVDVSQRALRLVTALFADGQEVGPPTPLPPVQHLPGLSPPYSLTPRNYVLLSFKQPVPRIQPSPSLSLVVEVQAARDQDVHGQEVLKPASCGWTQMELFDQYNQLHSGHWRVPVRSLPIRPSLSFAQLNSVPQVGDMELCVRLVNGRDGDVQTQAKLNPTSTSHYKYPTVASTHPAAVHRNTALPVSAPQPTGVDELSSLLSFPDHQDPPPTETKQSLKGQKKQCRKHLANQKDMNCCGSLSEGSSLPSSSKDNECI
ncbi:coiled-coil domain-containing protein 17 [Plectropomus leopardus]|uniref:coiled-coil domain-containing protein 17 n=1 Tax=Plectropomus leopardus TaxID=160734 RepID=UPI001C4AE9AF|nr:coiled-coil domain-containing protein 17 [Plectropomus leopardus]